MDSPCKSLPNLDTLQMPWERCERCSGAMGRLLPSIATGSQIWGKCDGCNGTGKRLRWPAEVVLLAKACVAMAGATPGPAQPPYYALADMLEEKGWPELSEHFRSSGPHLRGCFVLELLTGGTTP